MKAETVLVLAGIAGAAYLVYRARNIGDALNPASSENIAYQGASSVASTISGQPVTFGGWLWELLHPGQVAQEAALAAPIEGP